MDIGFSALPELVSSPGSIGGLSHIQLVGMSGSRDKAVTKWPTVVTDRFHEVQAQMTFQAAFLVFLVPIAWLLPAIADESMVRAV